MQPNFLNNDSISDQYYQQQQQDNLQAMGSMAVTQPIVENQQIASAQMHCYLHNLVHGGKNDK